MRTFCILLMPLLTVSLALAALADDEAPKPAPPGTLVVVDGGGKEHKLKSWKFTAGVRRLGWLADDKSAGPEALVVREERKINFLAGVTTLVPLDRIRAVTFDEDGRTMTVRAATGGKPEEDATLLGTTAYKGINKLALEAEVDKGDAGIAEVTFRGGELRGGIQAIRFPTPKVAAGKAGRPAVVVSADRDIKKTHKVSDLLPLYRFKGGREKTAPVLFFRKTLKLDVGKIKKIAVSGEDSDDVVWQVGQKDGDDATLTLLQTASVDGQPAELVGLVGKVPAGYKLFPLRRIGSVEFDSAEEAKEGDKEKGGDKETLPRPKGEEKEEG